MNLTEHKTFEGFVADKPTNISLNDLKKLLKNEKIYILMGGAPGSGKSYVVDKEFGNSIKVLDMDAYVAKRGGSSKEDYKKNGMKARVDMRKDSDKFLKDGTSFIKQGVSAGLNAVTNQAAQAKDFEFITVFFYIDVALKTALKRNTERVAKGERESEVPEFVVNRKRDDSLKVLKQIKNLEGVFDYVIVYKN